MTGNPQDEFWYITQDTRAMVKTGWGNGIPPFVANSYSIDGEAVFDFVVKNENSVMGHNSPLGYEYHWLPVKFLGKSEGIITWGSLKSHYSAIAIRSFVTPSGKAFDNCVLFEKKPEGLPDDQLFVGRIVVAAGIGIVYTEGKRGRMYNNEPFSVELVEMKNFKKREITAKIEDPIKGRPKEISVYPNEGAFGGNKPWYSVKTDNNGMVKFSFYGDRLDLRYGRTDSKGEFVPQISKYSIYSDTDTSNLILRCEY